jgi:hypothetical protein
MSKDRAMNMHRQPENKALHILSVGTRLRSVSTSSPSRFTPGTHWQILKLVRIDKLQAEGYISRRERDPNYRLARCCKLTN